MNWNKESGEIRPTKEQLMFALKHGIAQVDFVKADGTRRVMHASLMVDHMPKDDAQTEDWKNSTGRASNPDVVCCVDTLLKEWRSFRLDSLVSFAS